MNGRFASRHHLSDCGQHKTREALLFASGEQSQLSWKITCSWQTSHSRMAWLAGAGCGQGQVCLAFHPPVQAHGRGMLHRCLDVRATCRKSRTTAPRSRSLERGSQNLQHVGHVGLHINAATSCICTSTRATKLGTGIGTARSVRTPYRQCVQVSTVLELLCRNPLVLDMACHQTSTFEHPRIQGWLDNFLQLARRTC